MAAGRKDPCPCGSGRQYKACCYPRDRARETTLEAARESHRVIDALNAELLPLVESRGEHKIACRAGCNACCVSFVRVTPAQATLLADWLGEPGHEHLLARLCAWLPRWREAAGPEVAAIEAVLAEHHGSPPDGPEQQRYLELVATYERRRLMCPFNDEHGNCAVYPVRPTPCRTWNVIGTADNCGPDPPAPPIVLRHPGLSRAILDARALVDRAAEANGQPTGERNLMNALAEIIEGSGGQGR